MVLSKFQIDLNKERFNSPKIKFFIWDEMEETNKELHLDSIIVDGGEIKVYLE